MADLTPGDCAMLLKCIEAEAANMQFSALPKEKLDALRFKIVAIRDSPPSDALGDKQR